MPQRSIQVLLPDPVRSRVGFRGGRRELLGWVLVPALFWGLVGCQNPALQVGRSLADLSPGMWVNVQGQVESGSPTASKIDEVKRTSSSASNKLEVTGQAESRIDKEAFKILGRSVDLVEKTEFQDLEQAEVPRFPIEPGDWLRVKMRIKEDNRLRAREVRRIAPAQSFKIEGEITAIDPANGSVDVGTIHLRAPQDTRIHLLGDLEQDRVADDPLAIFLSDDQKSLPFSVRLTDSLLFGGGLRLKAEWNDEFDLDGSSDRDRTSVSASLNAALLWIIDDRGSFAMVEGGIGRKHRFNEGRPDATFRNSNLTRAYVYYRYSDHLRVQVGRQDFDDEREWIYDELLDGVRLYSSFGALDFEVAASTGREIADEPNSTEGTETFVGLVRYHINEDHRVTAYAVQRRDDSVANFESQAYGLRSYSRPSKGLGHWAELAMARGDDGTDRIDGYAFDVGFLYRSRLPLRPTIFAGYAYARGERPGSGRVGFRQTGLQDNNGKFGGVTSYKYYGEILEPELANMSITTVGVGIRPVSGFSLDLIGHSYRQDFKSTVIRSDNLRATTNGVSANIGWEADLVLGYRFGSNIRGELIFAQFEPGSAFDDRTTAHKVEFLMRFKF